MSAISKTKLETLALFVRSEECEKYYRMIYRVRSPRFSFPNIISRELLNSAGFSEEELLNLGILKLTQDKKAPDLYITEMGMDILSRVEVTGKFQIPAVLHFAA